MARLAFGDRLFAALYDRLASGESATMAGSRCALLKHARGLTVEIGAGTGENLPAYPRLDRLVLVEPSPAMRRRLEPRARRWEAEVVDATAEHLPFADASVDTVVCTLVLCSVDDPQVALREIRRVLHPGGRLLLLEHVRAADARVAVWQDRVDPFWKVAARGCHPNRATLDEVERAGFTLFEQHNIPVVMPGARFVPHVAAVAG